MGRGRGAKNYLLIAVSAVLSALALLALAPVMHGPTGAGSDAVVTGARASGPDLGA
jgi:hypothetical protein